LPEASERLNGTHLLDVIQSHLLHMKDSLYENSVFITALDAKGVVYTTVKEGAQVEIEHALENTEFVRELSQEKQSQLWSSCVRSNPFLVKQEVICP
jgi:hypothetical protein